MNSGWGRVFYDQRGKWIPFDLIFWSYQTHTFMEKYFWKYFEAETNAALKTCMEICMSEKVCKNTCNII